MVFVVRLEQEQEQQFNQLAQRLRRSRRSCVREAIAQYMQRFEHNDEARRQSAVIAMHLQNRTGASHVRLERLDGMTATI